MRRPYKCHLVGRNTTPERKPLQKDTVIPSGPIMVLTIVQVMRTVRTNPAGTIANSWRARNEKDFACQEGTARVAGILVTVPLPGPDPSHHCGVASGDWRES